MASGGHTTAPTRARRKPKLPGIAPEAGAVLLSFGAAVLLYLSFTATSSDVTFVTGNIWVSKANGGNNSFESFTALCIAGQASWQYIATQGPAMDTPCPKGTVERKVAIVTRDSSILAAFGLSLLVLSTAWQVWLIVRARSGK